MRYLDDDPAWIPIPDYERYWTPFDAAYSFAPSSADHNEGVLRPGIAEPLGSVTFSLTPITQSGAEAMYCAGVQALNADVLRAFVQVFPEDERLVALDWQHPSYWFRPHAHASRGSTPHGMEPAPWLVSPYPDGDYYIFLTEDLTSGTFGIPGSQVSACSASPSSMHSLRRSQPGCRSSGGKTASQRTHSCVDPRSSCCVGRDWQQRNQLLRRR